MYENHKNLSILIGMNHDITLTIDQKKELFKVIEELIGFAMISRREGLLAIENLNTEHFLIKKGIELITAGTDPVIVEQMLAKQILSGCYQRSELVKRLIIMDGIIGIQYGENPIRLMDHLASWLGEEFEVPYEVSDIDMIINNKAEEIKKRMQNE